MGGKIKKIEVFGSGCASCQNLLAQTREAVAGAGIGIEVGYIDDVQKAMEMGVMSLPVLAINGEPVIVGMVPGVGKVKEAIINYQKGSADAGGDQCIGGGR